MALKFDHAQGQMIYPEVTAPGTPAANTVAIYAKSDGLFYSKDDAGNERLMAGPVEAANQILYGTGTGVTSEAAFTYNPSTNTLSVDNVSATSITATSITTTSPSTFSTGSAAAPSITFTGDTDTGLYNAGANQIGFSTGGSARMVLSNTGLDMQSLKISNVADPTSAQDVATKYYVDSVAAGFDPKASVRLATTTALPSNTPSGSGVGKTLTATANGALSVDGVTVAVNDRILVKNEASAVHNGIYVVTATGDGSNPYVLTRATDFDGSPSGEVSAGNFTFVEEGTVNADTGWIVLTNNPITVDTTPINWTQFSGAGAVSLTFAADSGSTVLNSGDTLTVSGAQGVTTSITGTTLTINGPSEPANQLVYGTGSGLDSSSTLTYNVTTGAFTLNPGSVASPGAVAISAASSSTAATAGANITLTGGTGNTTGAGGNISVTGGTGGATANGGAITITGGAGGSTSGNGGTVSLVGGTPTDGNGGSIAITAGDGVGTNRDGGNVTITAGDPTGTGTAGVINLVTPSAGEIQINGSAGTSGQVLTSNGSGAPPTWQSVGSLISEPANQVVYGTGSGIDSDADFTYVPSTGQFWVNTTSGSAGSVSVTSPGSVGIFAASHSSNGAGGGVVIGSGDGGGSGNGGVLALQAGAGGTNGNGGAITIDGGAGGTTTGTGGNVTIGGGNATAGTGGNIILEGGNGGGSSVGGAITLTGGQGGATGAGGSITITGGTGGSTSGNGGSISIIGGTPSAGDGGSVTITGADATSATYNGGNLILTTGQPGTGGTSGRLYIVNKAGGYALHRSGNFATDGDAQTGMYILRTQTTDATQTEMFLDGTGGSRRMVLPNDTTWRFEIMVVARRTDADNESAAYKFTGAIDRNTTAASTAIVGTVSESIDAEDTAAWSVSVDADTTNGSLRIRVTGEAAKTIRWVAFVRTVEVTG